MKIQLAFLFTFFFGLAISQSNQELTTFEAATGQFLSEYVIDGLVDYKRIEDAPQELKAVVDQIKSLNLEEFNATEKQAFLINAYNLLVIYQITEHYPVNSVKEIPGFFDRNKYDVGGQRFTLNQIEKEILLKEYKDSRFHIVLVCGAKDCPQLWNQVYTSSGLEEQMEERSRAVLNDSEFVKESDEGYSISEIFKWNTFEFGGKKGAIEYINNYRENKIPENAKVNYYSYDWTLNDIRFKGSTSNKQSNNSYRYVTSAAIPKGGIEIKIFNNLYSEIQGSGENGNLRSTYFTTLTSFLYGVNNRFNLGFAARYRRVLNNNLPSSPFDVLGSVSGQTARQRITAFGPQIRWAPFESLPNFSIQSQFTFPIGDQLSGSESLPYLDWNGPVFWTQFFNDKSIGDKFSLFTEIDLLIEEIGSGKANQVSTPMTMILSWFPIKNFTVYGLAGYSPIIASPYNYFYQFGLGTKYQITPNFELEILVTDFSNRFLNSINGSAATYNFGFRYSR